MCPELRRKADQDTFFSDSVMAAQIREDLHRRIHIACLKQNPAAFLQPVDSIRGGQKLREPQMQTVPAARSGPKQCSLQTEEVAAISKRASRMATRIPGFAGITSFRGSTFRAPWDVVHCHASEETFRIPVSPDTLMTSAI